MESEYGTYAVCSTVLVRRWRRRVLLSLYNGLWIVQRRRRVEQCVWRDLLRAERLIQSHRLISWSGRKTLVKIVQLYGQ